MGNSNYYYSKLTLESRLSTFGITPTLSFSLTESRTKEIHSKTSFYLTHWNSTSRRSKKKNCLDMTDAAALCYWIKQATTVLVYLVNHLPRYSTLSWSLTPSMTKLLSL